MPAPRDGFIEWIGAELDAHQWSTNAPLNLQPLAGDAGCRRYFRLAQNVDSTLDTARPKLLAVDAPPQVEDSQAFVELGEYLRNNGVHTPEIIAADIDRGFLLVEDFGDELLQGALNPDSVELLYGECLMTLLRLQQCQQPPELVSNYDKDFLRLELNIFNEWFLKELLGHRASDAECVMLDSLFEQLENSATGQPQVLVHRDFHSRNLLVTEGGAPGVVDFQGALLGPVTYDLVSLLRDCYIRWPREDVKRWALAYGNMALEVGILPAVVSEKEFLRWFDLMGLQRHIKVLGIFARLALRDGKQAYLQDLPLVIRYVLEVAEEYSEFKPFVDWFKIECLPKLATQDWYSDYTKAGEFAESNQ